ncbi:MAG: GntR family transcriptional regulator [Actinomycetota bacterium]|nr:MAG: GntR family transcriptional regulator [Actinomycetota bacterium]
MKTIPRGKSLVEDVYELVRRRILVGDLTPGQRLHLSSLAADFGVSLGVVREALTRLASEELAVASPQQGFRVRSLSVPDLEDLTWVRIEVESIALRRAVTLGTVRWESDVVAAHHVLRATAPFVDGKANPEWMTVHSVFHAAVASACGSPTLLRVRQELFDAAEVYRYWARFAPKPDRDISAEHAAICDAAVARDADQLVAAMTQHITATFRTVLAAHDAINGPGSAAAASCNHAMRLA